MDSSLGSSSSGFSGCVLSVGSGSIGFKYTFHIEEVNFPFSNFLPAKWIYPASLSSFNAVSVAGCPALLAFVSELIVILNPSLC